MATVPEGQSCGNCDFWIEGTCRRQIASTYPGGSDASRWTSCPATGWCPWWNIWPSGASPRIGSYWSYGEDDPSGGNDGDWYIKQIAGSQDHTGYIYTKVAGEWTFVISTGTYP
jgi:hypothetical protein